MKRVVMMVVDGLRADLLSPGFTPHLAGLASRSRHHTAHRAVFPSATRVNSASIATGCYPGRHGLLGNAIALDEGDGLVPVSVGSVEFRERWRRASGATLSAPTLSQHLRERGGVLIHSNSSPGAAHMQDPDGHGTLLHRSGSHAPGFTPIDDHRHPRVGYDGEGDLEVTRRFCSELHSHPCALSLLWICEPDHSQHELELGSPQHRDVLQGADECVRQVALAVQEARDADDEILFMICSDHGHETVSEIVPVGELMADAGVLDGLDAQDIVLASSGMGALIFASARGRERIPSIAGWLSKQPWCEVVHTGDALAQVGLAPRDALELAFAMAKTTAENRFGIPGCGAVVADPFMANDTPGRGQHGGLGRFETNACLLLNGPGITPGPDGRPSCAVDLAPTALDFLGVGAVDMDGRSLL